MIATNLNWCRIAEPSRVVMGLQWKYTVYTSCHDVCHPVWQTLGTPQERRQKMEEIDTLEVQLKEGTMLLREFEVRIQDIPNHLSLINFNSECEGFHHLAIWICEIQFLPIQASTATPNWLTPVWSGPLMVYSLWWMYDGLCTSSSTGSIWWCPKCLETVRLPLSHNVQHDSAPPVESIGPLFTMCLIVFPNGSYSLKI